MLTLLFSDWTWGNILIRMMVSLVIGMIIGIDRTLACGGTFRSAYREQSLQVFKVYDTLY